MLPSFGWHATHRAVRSKVLYRIVDLPNLLEYTRNLRGSKAATLLSLLQEVRWLHLVILFGLSRSGTIAYISYDYRNWMTTHIEKLPIDRLSYPSFET